MSEELTCSPLDAIDPERQFDEWEYVLYIMTLAFLLEGQSLCPSLVHATLTLCRGYQGVQGISARTTSNRRFEANTV